MLKLMVRGFGAECSSRKKETDMEKTCTPGIPDSAFIRGDVPMTKEEIRVLSVCKLHLDANSVVYDELWRE